MRTLHKSLQKRLTPPVALHVSNSTSPPTPKTNHHHKPISKTTAPTVPTDPPPLTTTLLPLFEMPLTPTQTYHLLTATQTSPPGCPICFTPWNPLPHSENFPTLCSERYTQNKKCAYYTCRGCMEFWIKHDGRCMHCRAPHAPRDGLEERLAERLFSWTQRRRGMQQQQRRNGMDVHRDRDREHAMRLRSQGPLAGEQGRDAMDLDEREAEYCRQFQAREQALLQESRLTWPNSSDEGDDTDEDDEKYVPPRHASSR